MAETVHQLEVTLREVKPLVWRRIVVRSNATLGELALHLEAAMGWEGSHLHLFEAEGRTYGQPDPDWETDDLDEEDHRVGEVLPEVGSALRLDYDFGDGWEHDVVVEEIAPLQPDVHYPICLDGARACPPEDCGGPQGYAHLMRVLADPSLADPEGLRQWAPPGFDPASFDAAEATRAMHSPRLEDW